MSDFLELAKLIGPVATTIIAILVLGIFLAILAGVFFFLIKPLSSKLQKTKKVKIAGQEVEFDGDEQKAVVAEIPNNSARLIDTMLQVVHTSISAGYSNCKIRTSLYQAQLDKIKSQIELLKNIIADEYYNSNGPYFHLITKVLDTLLEDHIAKELKNICIRDRLLESTRDKFIDNNRSFITSAFINVKHAMVTYKNAQVPNEDQALVALSDLENIINKHENDFSRNIIDCLEKLYDIASEYTKELDTKNQEFDEHISRILKSYMIQDQETIPENWITGEQRTPPLDIVGGQ